MSTTLLYCTLSVDKSIFSVANFSPFRNELWLKLLDLVCS